MRKKEILAILLLISLFSPNIFALSAETTKPAIKQTKTTAANYRFEYINVPWWDKFNDPILKDYILKAVNNNHDLKMASLRVGEFQANVQEAFGKELPSVAINPDYMRLRIGKNLFPGDFMQSISQNVFMMPLTASYELDFLRKNREATIGAKKELEAVRYDEKAAYISISSIVATTYFNIIKTDKTIELQQEIISLRKGIFEITKERNIEGLSPTSDVILAEKSLVEAESELKNLEKQQSILLNQLAVLTGQSVDNALNFKRTSIEQIELISSLPSSVQTELVLERPDILKAEAVLQKSKIDVSLARKDFLPNFTISGQFGFASSSLKNLFNWESYLASLSAGIAQSLFSGGQKKARLKAKKFKYEQMLENYQKSILVAFQEINDSLVSLKVDNEKNSNNLNRVDLGNKHFDILKTRYEEGDISYFETLQYKEQLVWLKRDQIQSKTDCLIDSLSLYKALGGNL